MSLPMPTCAVTGTPAPRAGGCQAEITVGKLFAFDGAADTLAQSLAARGGDRDDVVEPAGLVPEAKLAAGDPFGHVLAGAAEHREFVVMNDAGAVGRQVRNDSSLDQVDQKSRQAKLDRVAAQHGNHRPAAAAGRDDGVDERTELGMIKTLLPAGPTEDRRRRPDRGRAVQHDVERFAGGRIARSDS